MKQRLFFNTCALFLIFTIFCSPAWSQQNLKFLQVKKPVMNQGSKKILLVSTVRLYDILQLDKNPDSSGILEIINSKGNKKIRLGKLKKGEIRWAHRSLDSKWLMVELDQKNYSDILTSREKKEVDSGYQLQITQTNVKVNTGKFAAKDVEGRYFSKNKSFLVVVPLSFAELPDIKIKLEYPITIICGEDIAKKVKIKVTNTGSGTAENVSLVLAVSESSKFAPKNIKPPGEYTGKSPCAIASLNIAKISPKQSIEAVFPSPLRLPEAVPPGKYYMAAVADHQNKIREFSKTNNFEIGFTFHKFPEIESMSTTLTGAVLSFEPETYNLKINCQGAEISNGKDWRKCRIRPYLYQLRHANWKNHHWEINTVDRGIWEIRNAKFCNTGGNARELKARVKVVGGSRFSLPSKVTVFLDEFNLNFSPAAGKVVIMAQGSPVEYAPAWKAKRISPFVYRFKNLLWPDYFWEFNLFSKTGFIMGGKNFLAASETKKPLDTQMKISFFKHPEAK